MRRPALVAAPTFQSRQEIMRGMWRRLPSTWRNNWGGWVRFRAAKILDPQALAIRPRRTSGSLYQGPGKEAAFRFLSHCGALKAKPRQSTQRGGASNASNSDIGSPAERPSHIDEAPAPGRGCLDFAKPWATHWRRRLSW
jgi:hypothetical protein